jgi:hypothetical protein
MKKLQKDKLLWFHKSNLTRKKIILIFNWFKNKFGESPLYNKPLRIMLFKSEGTSIDSEGCQGTYMNGVISIFLKSITSTKELCGIVAHEYKHYLISSENNIEYNFLNKYLRTKYKNENSVYKNHPHEKRCRRFQNKWGPLCYKELKNKLKKNE